MVVSCINAHLAKLHFEVQDNPHHGMCQPAAANEGPNKQGLTVEKLIKPSINTSGTE